MCDCIDDETIGQVTQMREVIRNIFEMSANKEYDKLEEYYHQNMGTVKQIMFFLNAKNDDKNNDFKNSFYCIVNSISSKNTTTQLIE
tara:strand:- start:2854 stop:3114 length:261 start_codon:yes stop_codon:yes gene_type:complete